MFGLKLVKEEYLNDLKSSLIKQERRCEDLVSRSGHSASRNISLKSTNNALERNIKGMEAELVEAKNKNEQLRSDVDGLEIKLINSQNDLAELSEEYSKLQEKYNFEHVENKMKIKGFDRGQYYQVLGISSKAGMFAKLGSISTRDLRGKIFNFDQLKDEILKRGLNVSSLDIVRVDVKI